MVTSKIKDGISFYRIADDKFKSVIFRVNFLCPLERSTVTKNALLSLVLRQATKNYPNMTVLNEALSELYGARISVNTIKHEGLQILSFTLSLVSDRYLPESIFNDALGILGEIIFNPLLEKGNFSSDITRREMGALKDMIEGLINDKWVYGKARLLENMCGDEPIALREFGYVGDIGDEDLYRHYSELIKSAPIEAFIVGAFDDNSKQSAMDFLSRFEPRAHKELKPTLRKSRSSVRTFYEDDEVNQGKIVMGFNIDMDVYRENIHTAFVFNALYGNGTSSRLFLNVREAKSLCYRISSSIDRQQGIMYVLGGIDFDKFEVARDSIIGELSQIKSGNITEHDLAAAKAGVTNILRSTKDEIAGMVEFYTKENHQSIDGLVEGINNVDVYDCTALASSCSLDTVYFLRGGVVENDEQYEELQ